MSELDEALRDAVKSIEAGSDERSRDSSDRETRTHPQLHQASALPALRAMRSNHLTFADVLRHEFRHGEILAGAWLFLREALYVLLLFWVAAVLLGFGEAGGEVVMPLFGPMSVIDASFVTALVLRVVLVGGASLNHVIDRRVDGT